MLIILYLLLCQHLLELVAPILHILLALVPAHQCLLVHIKIAPWVILFQPLDVPQFPTDELKLIIPYIFIKNKTIVYLWVSIISPCLIDFACWLNKLRLCLCFITIIVLFMVDVWDLCFYFCVFCRWLYLSTISEVVWFFGPGGYCIWYLFKWRVQR